MVPVISLIIIDIYYIYNQYLSVFKLTIQLQLYSVNYMYICFIRHCININLNVIVSVCLQRSNLCKGWSRPKWIRNELNA
jgi:hypothetical protein